jgi:RHS repeat-associated protein
VAKAEDKNVTKTTSKAGGPHKAPQQMPMVKGAGTKASSAGKHKGTKDKKKAKKGSTKKSVNPAEECQDGHPVDVFSGAVVDSQTDFWLKGLFRVGFTRKYNSSWSTTDGPFGRCGWTHVFHQVAERVEPPAPDGPEQWRVRGHDGRWIDLGDLPRDERVFRRGSQLEILRRDIALEIRSLRTRLTRVFERAKGDDRYRLRALNNERGLGYRFEWQGDRLVHAIDTAGRELRFSYDGHARLIHLGVWVEGKEVQWVDFGYHDTGELAWVRNAVGYEDRFEYDGLHRMVEATLKNGVGFHYDYADDGRCRRTYGDGGLHTRELKWNRDSGEVVSSGTVEAKVRTFDARGNLVEERTIDGQFKRTQAFDDDGLLVAETNGLGETTSYEHDGRGHLVKRTDPAGNETTWKYEDDLWTELRRADGSVLHRKYNQYAELVETTKPTGERCVLDYDEHGRLVAAHGPKGLLGTLGYDSRHDLVWARDADGGTVRNTYDAMGRMLTETDATGGVTRIERDTLGRALTRVRQDGGTTRCEYGPAGATRVTNAVGGETRISYCGTGRVQRVVEADGGEWLLVYDRDERLVEVRNPKAERYRFTYDRLGRPLGEETFDGREIRYSYDLGGRLRRVQRSDQSWREFTYDALGSVVQATSAHGTITFERDPVGRVLRAAIEDGPETIEVAFERDDFGRIVAERQGQYSVEREYDDEGRPKTRKVLGETTRYAYDAQGRWSEVEHAGHRVRFERDAKGRETRRSWQEVAVVDSHYDRVGRLAERRVLGAPGGAEGLTVDEVTVRTLGDVPFVEGAWSVLGHRRWSHDRAGRMLAADDRTWGHASFGNDAIGRLVSVRRGPSTEGFEYDPAGGLLGVLRSLEGRSPDRRPWSVAAGNVLIADDEHDYRVDGCHRRVERTRKGGGDVTEYDWDDWDRLRQVKRADGLRIRYFYDAFGRRVRKELWRPLDSEQLARAMTAVGESSAPDAPPADPDATVEVPVESLIVTHFVWDRDRLVGEVFPGGQRVHVHERNSFTPMLQSERGEVLLVVADRNGTPRELVDDRGALAWAACYRAWGQIDREWRAKGDGPRSPFRLLGQYFDEETGLAATRFRYWDASTARWLSPDPLRILGGKNLFAFNGNPLVDADPFGLCLIASVEVEGEGSLNQNEALQTHTEPKFLSDVQDMIDSGDIDPDEAHLVMQGELPPCQPGCQPAIRDFVDQNGVTAEYNEVPPDGSEGSSWAWEPAADDNPRADVMQTKTNPDGSTETRRYWRTSSGGWDSAPVPDP